MLSQIVKGIHERIYKYRIKVLSEMIIPFLNEGDKVLDIGCGSGRLGGVILGCNRCPRSIKYTGIEKIPRGGEPIDVIAYVGNTLPMEANSFDVVILADVLHHEKNPLQLIMEARRVSKKIVIIKDHKKDYFFDQLRISILDFCANNPHDIECIYEYNTLQEWHSFFEEAKLTIEKEQLTINLYQWFFNIMFGKNLQYFCVCIK
jgi:ubiquinone/menaquinone biosynthesis C-methylase UbiE